MFNGSRTMTVRNRSGLISVIIPVYNVAAELPRCLDSVLANTYRNLEIICIDDGSPDNCGEILDEYAAKDGRVIVIHQRNQGVAAARNHGMKIAHGDAVAFIDSDDWIHPQYFEILVYMMHETDADVSICESVTLSAPEEYAGYEPSVIVPRMLSIKEIQHNYTARYRCWARLYRREMLIGHKFSGKIRIGDDTIYNLDVLCHYPNLKVCYTDFPLYCYFVRADSITHSRPLTGVLDEAKWYYHYYRNEKEVTGMEWMLRSHAIKTVLSSRYWSMFDEDYAKKRFVMNQLLRRLLPGILKSRYAPMQEKLMLCVMANSPALYRLFQHRIDPTVKDWEKANKSMLGKGREIHES